MLIGDCDISESQIAGPYSRRPLREGVYETDRYRVLAILGARVALED